MTVDRLRAGSRSTAGSARLLLVGAGVMVVGLLLLSGALVGATRPGPTSAATHESPRIGKPTEPSVGTGSTGPVPAVAHPSVVAPTWVNVTQSGPGVAPPTGYAESVAYDPLDHVTLLVGGCLADQCPSNQTWTFSNGAWTNITSSSGSPPARQWASMDFDPNMGGLLLFGGEGVGGVLLNDTWLFSGGRWTNVSYVGGGPSPRLGASMAFDPDPEENGSVLYGGCVPALLSYDCDNDTWVWQGWSGWVELQPSLNGPGVGFSAMAYDPVDGYLVLFGGCAGVLCFDFSGQTWEFYGGQWWEVRPATAPSARADASIAYDPAGDQLVLFGGLDASLYFDADTWSFAGGVWKNVSPATAPLARSDFGLALDPTGTTLLLVGGETVGPTENDTWAYEVPDSVSLAASAAKSETNQSVTFTATVSGGTGPYDLLVAFGDGTDAWLTGEGPTFSVVHAYPQTGTYVASVNLTDSVGGGATASAASVHVSAGPAFTASAQPVVGEVGIPVSFTTNVTSSGTPPLTYLWKFGDGGSTTGAAPSHAYAAAGSYTVLVTATDGLGVTANSSLMVMVVPAPAVTISFLPSGPTTHSLVMFTATVSGGVGPFQYAWRFGDGNSSAEPSPVQEFDRAGQFTVTVYVNDSVGGSAHTSMTVTVASPPSSSSSGATVAGAPVWFWGGLGGLAVLAAAGTTLLVRRGRARGPA